MNKAMKNISQYLQEFREEFRCSCGHTPFGEHIEPNATYKEMEDFFRKALTEVAKGMVGEKREYKDTTVSVFSAQGHNQAIADQEEKFNKFIK
jgi:hypothetical protein